jgi:diguanylate cyclase (GGDEF)-like protein/PAS domain S-box-containing protein
MKRLPITVKAGLVLLVPAIGAFVALGAFYWYLDQTAADASFINIAGRQRMISGQLHHYAQMTHEDHGAGRPALRKLVKLFNRSLTALERGGEISGRTLPPAPTAIANEITEVKRHWRNVRQKLLLIANRPAKDPEAGKAYKLVGPGIQRLLKLSDRVVAAYEVYTRKLRRQILTALVLILLFNLAMLIIGIMATRFYTRERKSTEDSLGKLAMGSTGDTFFSSLVENIAQTLGVNSVLVSEIDKSNQNIARTIVIWHKGRLVDNFEYELAGMPCGEESSNEICYFPHLFPKEKWLSEVDAECLLGEALYDTEGQVSGLVAIFDNKPLQDPEFARTILRVFAVRAGAELERKRVDEALRESEAEWRRTFDSVPDLISLHDRDFRILRANKAFESYFSLPSEKIIGQYCYELFHCRKEPTEECPHAVTMKTGKIVTHEVDNSKMRCPLSITTSPLYDENADIIALIHVAKDITLQKQNENRLLQLAHFDHLTGLPNRTLFFDRLSQLLSRAHRHERLTAVLFLDLDRFKIINDTMGHDTGDQLLKAVSSRLKGTVREGDTVGRLGGDEYAIILTDVADILDIPETTKAILSALEKPFELSGREYFITASIGISVHPDNADNAKDLITFADIAMYHAKELGRNNYQFYSPTMDDKAPERLVLETNLRHALDREEFQLHYQPLIDLYTGRITSVEVLLRWQPEDSSLIYPVQFMSLLEETGMIVPINEWVLRTACRQNKSWQEQGLPKLRIAVNLSAHQFKQQNLVEIVARSLEASGLEAQYLEVELTESILMEHIEKTTIALEELDAMGVTISIDDFGTGYSSLNYLKQFPIHALKIDRSFIRDINDDENDAALTRAIIAMAHSLDISVIAEGVENKGQMIFLQKNRCDKIQGYYFSRPLSTEEFTRLLEKEENLDINPHLHAGNPSQHPARE